jgi:branched-chain amino acid transport system ATP-binding protein
MSTTAVATTLLKVEDLWAGYGPVQVLHGVTFEVNLGEVVVILGANGAGKTTTLRAICQMINTRGCVELDGESLVGRPTTSVVRRGLAHVPQGRGTFPELTVQDNLEVGAYVRKDKEINADIERWFEAFPRLAERRTQQAGSLSGGEQQMLAIARALMGRPRLLLLDEPSLGLAPIIVQDLFRRLGALNAEQGITMLLVEQNANLAFDIAHRAYVLETGQIALSGTSEELRNDEAVRRAYLGY